MFIFQNFNSILLINLLSAIQSCNLLFAFKINIVIEMYKKYFNLFYQIVLLFEKVIHTKNVLEIIGSRVFDNTNVCSIKTQRSVLCTFHDILRGQAPIIGRDLIQHSCSLV